MISQNVREILDEAERIDGSSPVSDQALLGVSQGKRTLVEHGAEAIGILGEGELDLVVRPAARCRGIGGELLTSLLARADAESPGELRAWAHGENPGAEKLLTAAGFVPVRTLFRMELAPELMAEMIENSPAMPNGFATSTLLETGDAAHEAWVRVNALAFASHPEQGRITLEDFKTLMQEPWFDPEDLIFAIDERDAEKGRRLAGYGWIKTIRTATDESVADTSGERVETELYVLGVDPEYAGRGLGAALLGESLKRMKQLGTTRVTLYVDGDNENAVTLYKRSGFTVDQQSTQWLRKATD